MAKNAVHPGMKIRRSVGDHIFNICNILFFILIAIIILFPFFNIFAISLTSNVEYMREPFIIWPKEPTLESYAYIFSTSLIPRSYVLTILITISATLLSTLVTSMLAYGLCRGDLRGQKFFMIYLLITMFFSGGLIPNYMNITKTLGWSNNLLALIVPNSVSVFNFIIVRSFSGSCPRRWKNLRALTAQTSGQFSSASSTLFPFRPWPPSQCLWLSAHGTAGLQPCCTCVMKNCFRSSSLSGTLSFMKHVLQICRTWKDCATLPETVFSSMRPA